MRIYSKCIISAAIIMCSCDVDPIPGRQNWGYLKAKVNGNEWSDTYKNAYQITQGQYGWQDAIYPCLTTFRNITSQLFTKEGYLRKELLFTRVPAFKGKYKINKYETDSCSLTEGVNAILYTSTNDGDVAGPTYNLLETDENYMIISKYKPETNEIWGEFKATFVFEGRTDQTIWRDTLRFIDGRFHTKMIEYKGK